MKKILICGFPHSGTSILKSIIGHCNNVYEIYDETHKITNEIIEHNELVVNEKKHLVDNDINTAEYILIKHPFTLKQFFDETNDYIKIFIMRNPLWVYSSLNRRFNNDIARKDCKLDAYLNTLELFSKYYNTNYANIYTIKYEEMFENNYYKLKDILNGIGLKYNDDIFDNSKYHNIIKSYVKNIPKEMPLHTDQINYRTYQINQKFTNNNDEKKIKNLPRPYILSIVNNRLINKIYPNIKLHIHPNLL